MERVRTAGTATNTGNVFELSGIRSDGAEFPLECSLASWAAEARLFFTAILRDSGARKQTEAGAEGERSSLRARHEGIE